MLTLSFIVDKYKIFLSNNPMTTENGYAIIRGLGFYIDHKSGQHVFIKV